jgi:hypothetical protein
MKKNMSCERAVEDRASQQIAQLAFIEGVAFARLDEVALDHQVGVAVDLDLESFFEIAGVISCHRLFPASLGCSEGLFVC